MLNIPGHTWLTSASKDCDGHATFPRLADTSFSEAVGADRLTCSGISNSHEVMLNSVGGEDSS